MIQVRLPLCQEYFDLSSGIKVFKILQVMLFVLGTDVVFNWVQTTHTHTYTHTEKSACNYSPVTSWILSKRVKGDGS